MEMGKCGGCGEEGWVVVEEELEGIVMEKIK